MLNTPHIKFKKKFCISLLEMFSLQFIMRLVIQDFVWLLMKLEMNPEKSKWPLLLSLLIEVDLYDNDFGYSSCQRYHCFNS